MWLENLHLLNFKNYEDVNLQFPSRVNVIVGKNGSGKTNLLDSIYYLSFTKSAFSPDLSLLRHEESYMMVRGIFRISAETHIISSSVQPGTKKIFRIDSQDYQKISSHIGKFPVVLIAPDDVDLIKEGGEERRRFFDSIISQLDHQYLEELMRYNHFLKQRSSLLKMAFERGAIDWVAVESYDDSIVKSGDYIFNARKTFLSEYFSTFLSYYKFLVDDREVCEIRYQSELLEQDFATGLISSRQKDLALQRTTFGIHRDDFVFTMSGRDIKRIGSQGQQKSFVIALKLAQYEILKKRNAFKPILLLDDIFDKLDDNRIGRLLELIKGDFGQLFITDARPDRTNHLLKEVSVESGIFIIENGKITT
ncbi:MAG: DNA replication/repair protein RecF [Chryseolinea sp.]